MFHIVAKGAENPDTGYIFSWWKSNFNMPVGDIQGEWTENYGPCIYHDAGTSFNVSGFSPGYEAGAFFWIFRWEGPLNGTGYARYEQRDTDNDLIGSSFSYYIEVDVADGYWQELWTAQSIGIAGWEIDESGNYTSRSWVTSSSGDDISISQKDTTIAFSNVPSVTQLGATKKGYIWVEGNNLCYINNNEWKHTMEGDNQGSAGSGKAGYMWIDTDNYLHWVGNDNNDYRVKWKVQQFASTWTNSSTGETNPGVNYRGYIWVDDEFGSTHLAYIGNNGYKWLVGAGNNPYIEPY